MGSELAIAGIICLSLIAVLLILGFIIIKYIKKRYKSRKKSNFQKWNDDMSYSNNYKGKSRNYF